MRHARPTRLPRCPQRTTRRAGLKRTLMWVQMLALLALAISLQPAWAAPGDPALSGPALWAVADRHQQQAYDQPAAALAALDQLLPATVAGGADWRVLLRNRGVMAAGANRLAEAEAAAQSLAATGALGSADAAVVHAAVADMRAASPAAIESTEAALSAYANVCPQQPEACDPRATWWAQQTLARHLLYQGKAARARSAALAGAETAKQARDTGRHALSVALAAEASAVLGDMAEATPLRSQARRLARLEGSPQLLARMALFESTWHARRGDTLQARQVVEQALPLALRAGSPRLHAMLLVNLSDLHLRSRQSQLALAAAEKALPVLRASADRRSELAALGNLGQARIGLGQLAAARSTLEVLLAAHRSAGAAADESETLREFGDAFARAGDLGTALSLYHREREQAAAIMASNRDAVLSELRERFDRNAQQRKLEQLNQENALVSAQIDNRSAMRKVWLACILLLGLAVALVGALYGRVRKINRRLAHNHAFLRAQSQRDPLTGLANRRALHELTAVHGVQQVFDGTLLLVDIDHFKHINDGHGHAVGDLVLVEVARRLAQVVGGEDLVVRWGGEEFLVYRHGGTGVQADALASEVLQALGGHEFELPGGPLRVTASVGYGAFPLPPAQLPLSMERAINFADMALYTAKNQGRNRAVGIAALQATDAQALAHTEADFDQAWQEGRVTLQRTQGPGPALAPTVHGQLAPA